MIQFNLLPDVKLEYIRARYRKRLIVGLSVISSGVFFTIFVLLFLFVRVSQTMHMSDLTKDIDSHVKQIKETPDLDKILTIQNQLNSLPELHSKKVLSSRLAEFLAQLTPQQATISDVEIDFAANSINIKGNADSLITVNKFADTLKFTKYKTASEDKANNNAFKEVVLKSFSIEETNNNTSQKVGYELNFVFEPVIFAVPAEAPPDNTPAVQLAVPKIISTRSETEKPNQLFVPQPEPVQPQPTTPGGNQ